MKKPLNLVLQEFRQVHGNKYNYNKVDYVAGNKKVVIVCPTHGEFMQTPNDHRHGHGCSGCSKNKNITQGEFIDRIIAVHGNTYDVSKAIYVNKSTKVTLTCNKHGDFSIWPSDLWRGVGCKKCGFEKQIQTKIEKGLILDPSLEEPFIVYRRKVRSITEKNYKLYMDLLNPLKLKRSKSKHLDHKYSIYEGFKNNISPDIIGHWANLTLIDNKTNQSKNTKSSVSIEELMAAFNSK